MDLLSQFMNQLYYDAIYYSVYTGVLWFYELKGEFLSERGFFYWPYIISAFVIILLVKQFPRLKVRGVAKSFSRDVLWHKSSRVDYIYYVINLAIFMMFLAPLVLQSVFVADYVAALLSGWFGDLNLLAADHWGVKLAYTLCFFIAYDFGRFLAHWLQHVVPFFWQFHKVHHSAERLNFFTSGRAHPVDLLLMAAGGNFFSGLVTGVFVFAMDGQLSVYLFLGQHVLIAAYRLIGHLRHSHVWLGYGPLEKLLVSPAMHQIHHSVQPEHFNKNMGFCFSFWDRVFGTFHSSRDVGEFQMGIGDGSDGKWHSLGRLYFWPFKLAVECLLHKRSQ